MRKLFGGINMNMFDGPRHATLKALPIHAFDRDALAAYLPDMQSLLATVERTTVLLGRPPRSYRDYVVELASAVGNSHRLSQNAAVA